MSKVVHLPITDEQHKALKALMPFFGGTIGNLCLDALKAYPPTREAFQTKETQSK